jgi:uncharacterized protein involved in tolerance to divalent cations
MVAHGQKKAPMSAERSALIFLEKKMPCVNLFFCWTSTWQWDGSELEEYNKLSSSAMSV